jgi:hypothetical protein
MPAVVDHEALVVVSDDFDHPHRYDAMLHRISGAFLVCILAVSPLFGQDWAKKMFKETSHDFGTVARSAKAEHAFEVTNIFMEDVHIASVRSSCGCTSVRVENPTLKTYEKGAIVATINSGTFLGQRGATLTVTIDKPYYAEVQLHDSVFIRSDVTVEPGSVQLGAVEQGQSAESKVNVSFTGRSDWKVREVKCSNPDMTAEVTETARRNGLVTYQLAVHLNPTAPAGSINEHLMLVTNDGQGTQIPVAVEGRVVSGVSVSPASLFMGVVQPGQKVTKQLVVKGAKPFRILAIKCDDKSFEFDTSTSSDAKPLHLVPVTFVAGADLGKVAKTVYIETDLGENKPELAAYAVVATP